MSGTGKLRRIDDPEKVKLLFFLCWLVYCTSYIGRLNYSSAMTLMITDGVLTASAAGFISMLYFFAYGTGQLINGILADRISPVRMIMTGLLLSAAANICMGLGSGFLFMTVTWGLNGFCQSMIWAPIIRIFAEMLSEYDKINCSVNIASSGVVGTLLSYLLSAALMAVLPWNSVFLSAAVLLASAAAVFYGGIRRVMARSEEERARLKECTGDGAKEALPGYAAGGKAAGEKPAGNKTAGTKSAAALIVSSGLLFLLIPVVIHGMLKDGVTAWVPTYISENFGMSASFSVLLTTVLPIINLTGAYAGRSLYQRTGKNIGLSLGAFFALSLGAIFLLLMTGRVSVFLTLFLLAVITSSMMAINTLAINVYPLRFEKYGRVSSMSGFLNAMAYLGSALSTYVIGLLVERRGWQTTMMTWLFGAALAFFLCLSAIKKVREV